MCDCDLWIVSGIPCKHIIACISKLRVDVEPYVDDSLKKATYLKTYSHVLHTIPDEASWPAVESVILLPPVKNRRKGRPRRHRKKGPIEPSSMQRSIGVRCSVSRVSRGQQRTCKQKGTKIGKRKQNQASTSSATPSTSAAAPSTFAPSTSRTT